MWKIRFMLEELLNNSNHYSPSRRPCISDPVEFALNGGPKKGVSLTTR